MSAPVAAATATFLDAAADDLQRQAGRAGVVEHVAAETIGNVVTLIATIRVGADLIEVRGSGDSPLTAYANLTRTTPEPMLAAEFRGVVTA